VTKTIKKISPLSLRNNNKRSRFKRSNSKPSSSKANKLMKLRKRKSKRLLKQVESTMISNPQMKRTLKVI
jgi:hypothetical protein